MKPWLFVILAVVALGVVFNDPENKAEGNSVMTSVGETFDPYLRQGFSEGAREEIEQRSREAADFAEETGADFGLELKFRPDR